MEFESVADKLVTHLYDQFDRDTIQLDRDQDENVFLQTSARYTYTLQQHLNMCALELIEKINIALPISFIYSKYSQNVLLRM